MLLPRLFTWLETSRKAASLVREWSISNTTLEQVFLLLCIQNTEVNYVDRRNEPDESRCTMCRERPKETALLRTLTGQIIVIPSSICSQCSSGNSQYIVSEEEGLSACGDPLRVNALLTKVQTKAALEMAQATLSEYTSQFEDESKFDGHTAFSPLQISPEGDEHTQLFSGEVLSSSTPGWRDASLPQQDPFTHVKGGSPITQVCSVPPHITVITIYVDQSNIAQERDVTIIPMLHEHMLVR